MSVSNIKVLKEAKYTESSNQPKIAVGRRFIIGQGKIAVPHLQLCTCHKTVKGAKVSCHICCTKAARGTVCGCKNCPECPCLKHNLLILLTVIGVVSGLVLGFILRAVKSSWSDQQKMYIGFVGEIFLRTLKALILPLIVASIITAIGSMDLRFSKKIGIRVIWYFLITTVIAVIEGIIIVWFIKPGRYLHLDDPVGSSVFKHHDSVLETLLDLVRNLFPPNLIQATIQTYTSYEEAHTGNKSQKAGDEPRNYEDGTNILGLVVFSIVLGIVITKLERRGVPLLAFAISLGEATMIMVHWLMWVSPIGVCSLIAAEVVGSPGPEKHLLTVLLSIGLYVATVIAGMIIHGAIVLPFLYWILARKFPYKFIWEMRQALFTAFGTSSSSVTLPVTIHCLDQKNKVDSRITRFVLPIGATMNMGGTALYEAVAAIWISQMLSDNMDWGKIIAISVTAAATSIGVAGIPQAGLVTMVMVLSTIGVNVKYIVYTIPVDWFLDRFRTVLNVLGDAFGAGVTFHWHISDLKEMGPPEDIIGVFEEEEEELVYASRMSIPASRKSRTSRTTTTASVIVNNNEGNATGDGTKTEAPKSLV